MSHDGSRDAAAESEPPSDPSGDLYLRSDLTVRPGDEIGPYRLGARLGEGGFGEVFRARQSRPVQRDVAIKIIKLGMDSREVLARFGAERQALADMDHPNIAKVFDAGVTTQGRPFFVMELVEGERVTDHCDRCELAVADRLAIFLQVCDAVTHAHRKGIIHRDLKPSNILVTESEDGRSARVIDFGVAKAIEPSTDDAPPMTRDDQLVGTPEYMSPELVESGSQHADTRADVYSLGVLLYELLVGASPISRDAIRAARRRGSREEIRRVLFESEIVKPSSRLAGLPADDATGVARLRSATPVALRGRLRDDLDWITMRALAPDLEQRYGSVAEIAADLRRHLRHEPVEAGPPSAAYRFKKFVRRRRALVAGGSLAAIGLLVGLVVALWALSEARSEQARKEEALRLFEFIPLSATPAARRGDDPSLADVMIAWLGEYDRSGAGDPEIDAFARHTLGRLLHSIGSYPEAIELLRRSVEIRVELLGEDHRDTRATRQTLALALWYERNLEEGEAILRELLDTQLDTVGTEDPTTLEAINNLGLFLLDVRRFDDADPLLTEAYETRRRLLGEGDPLIAVSMANLALLRRQQGRFDEAAKLFEMADETLARETGADHPWSITAAVNRSQLLASQGLLEEAEIKSRAALEHAEAIYEVGHPETIAARNVRAGILVDHGRLKEAETLLRRNVDLLGARGDRWPAPLLRTKNDLALCLQKQGRFAEAEKLFREALDGQRELLSEEHPDTLTTLNNLGTLYYRLGRYDEAEPILSRALDTCRRVLPRDHPDTLTTAANLAAVLAELDRHDEAIQAYETVVAIRVRLLGETHPATLLDRYNLGTAFLTAERYDDARRELADLLEIYREQQSAIDVLWTQNALAKAALLDGEPEAAEPLLRETVELARHERAIGAGEALPSTLIASWRSNHGECLTMLRRFEEAESLLLDSLATYTREAPEDTVQIATIRAKVAALYDAWGRPRDAARYRP